MLALRLAALTWSTTVISRTDAGASLRAAAFAAQAHASGALLSFWAAVVGGRRNGVNLTDEAMDPRVRALRSWGLVPVPVGTDASLAALCRQGCVHCVTAQHDAKRINGSHSSSAVYLSMHACTCM